VSNYYRPIHIYIYIYIYIYDKNGVSSTLNSNQYSNENRGKAKEYSRKEIGHKGYFLLH